MRVEKGGEHKRVLESSSLKPNNPKNMMFSRNEPGAGSSPSVAWLLPGD